MKKKVGTKKKKTEWTPGFVEVMHCEIGGPDDLKQTHRLDDCMQAYCVIDLAFAMRTPVRFFPYPVRAETLSPKLKSKRKKNK